MIPSIARNSEKKIKKHFQSEKGQTELHEHLQAPTKPQHHEP